MPAPRARPAIIVIGAIVLAGAVPSAVWALWPEGPGRAPHRAPPDRRYATQRGTSDDARQANIAQQSAEYVDGALEACGAVGLRQLAAKYRMPAEPSAVARRFANSYDPAYRERVFRACLVGFRHPG